MTASLKAIDGNADLPALMTELGSRARAAARVLALAPPEQKNRALDAVERAIRNHAPAILAAPRRCWRRRRAGWRPKPSTSTGSMRVLRAATCSSTVLFLSAALRLNPPKTRERRARSDLESGHFPHPRSIDVTKLPPRGRPLDRARIRWAGRSSLKGAGGFRDG